jgi:hypothetical protein
MWKGQRRVADHTVIASPPPVARRFALALAAICALVLAGAVSGPAAAKTKTKNPLAGSWTGTGTGSSRTTPNAVTYPISFTITKSGQVVGFTTAQEVDCLFPSGMSTPTVQGTISAPTFHLTKPTKDFPRGKQLVYQGAGGSPVRQVKIRGHTTGIEGHLPIKGHPPGFVMEKGKLVFRGHLAGYALGSTFQMGDLLCSDSGQDWLATRVTG